ncbi:MAG: hypothetical protein OMM_03051 [Candidatus Magnetoglobus multicellularis str. Araruama]|uniref:Carboxypeptidase regulatory-like domain-containing protein n=1 Tax=Candidatus Magnetoglobus multicellularis str. Araruama TaxID=890399 RepID=A0A1V1P731_9BACT|nr:MAG: hypothetical protein OMM_03051 [Candidatus Magnetoglobus multicellularis str. Araruama]
MDTSNTPINQAEVELYSHDVDFYVWTKTDAAGTFNIQCAPAASDYVLSVMPPSTASYVPFNGAGLAIDDSQTENQMIQKNIVLKTASYINGYIYKTDATTPVINAQIFVYSENHNYSSNGSSNEDGFYQINNIPIGSDYEITVKTDSYAKAIKIDQSTGTSVDFILESAGTISGKIIEEDGSLLADVLVQIKSETANFTSIGRTDSKGHFSVSDLQRYLNSGYEITDYLVTIFPDNYAEQSQGQKRVGEFVTFVCKKAELTGIITDSLGNPIPDGVVVGIRIYKNQTQGGYVTKTLADRTSQFTLNALLRDTEYQLSVLVLYSKIEESEQWIDPNGFGASERSDAGVYMAGSHIEVRLKGTWDE